MWLVIFNMMAYLKSVNGDSSINQQTSADGVVEKGES